MRAISVAIFSLCLLAASLLTGCVDDDFTTSPSHVLAFSTDTVAFDTIFTTIGTSTRSFRVYNPNKKSLNISTIKLADAEHSGFHINVDGMSGDYFTDVEIRGKDSLYVFVEANIDPTNQDNPLFIVDSIVYLSMKALTNQDFDRNLSNARLRSLKFISHIALYFVSFQVFKYHSSSKLHEFNFCVQETTISLTKFYNQTDL